MELTRRVHDLSQFMDTIKDESQDSNYSFKRARKVLEFYLRKKAKIEFLQSAATLVAIQLPDVAQSSFERLVLKKLKEPVKKFELSIEVSDLLKRIYDENGNPRQVHPVVLESILIDSLTIGVQRFKASGRIGYQYFKRHFEFIDAVLSHPAMRLETLDTTIHITNALMIYIEGTVQKLDSDLVDGYDRVLRINVVRFLEAVGPKQFVQSLLKIWDRYNNHRMWTALSVLVAEYFENRSKPRPLQIAEVCLELCAAAQVDGGQKAQAARDILNAYPYLEKENADQLQRVEASTVISSMAHCIKDALPDYRAHHALVLWLSVINEYTRLQLLLAICMEHGIGTDGFSVDERSEFLLESVLGEDGWKALCAFQKDELWADANPKDLGGNLIKLHRSGIDKNSEEYATLFGALEAVDFAGHNSAAVLAAEALCAEAKVTPIQADDHHQNRMFLLSGEVTGAVTHTYTHQAMLPRKKTDFLGSWFPKVGISQHPQLPDEGAACRFSIVLPDIDVPIYGYMDDEGEISFTNVLSVTDIAASALQAVVSDSLSRILFPVYVDSLPARGQAGRQIRETGEVTAVRPRIHTQGDLQNRKETPFKKGKGSKIHPDIATLLFAWLLGDKPECPFRIYARVSTKVKKRTEWYYRTDSNALALLESHQALLSDFYIRVVKAHTKPLGVYIDENGDIVVQKMSERAERNYRRYRRDLGRKLSFKSVRKTYVLPDGKRIVMDVPKTFNQGAFASLDEVLAYVTDPVLKARAREHFLV